MMVGLDGVEPSTSRLSGVRSNQTELQAPAILDCSLQLGPGLNIRLSSRQVPGQRPGRIAQPNQLRILELTIICIPKSATENPKPE